jgi:FAD/FMN-containing dehydrogenase
VRPSALATAAASLRPGTFLAELGVGLVHLADDGALPYPQPSTIDLNRRVKESFDPTGRLNPGRRVV